jgi:hypothetical protein
LLELLRTIRNALYDLSSIQVYGVGIDGLLHLVFAFAAIIVLHRYLGLKKSVYIAAALIVLKELVDIFAKSSVEYIRPPALDFFMDIGFGCAGVALAVLYLRRQSGKSQLPSAVNGAVSPQVSLVVAIVMALLSLLILVQGIYASQSRAALLAVSALGVLLFVGAKGRPDALLFFLVPLGPLINFPGFTDAPYMYNIEAVLLCYFSIWFIACARRVRLDASLLWLYALFFATLLPGIVVQWAAGNALLELRLVRGFFLGLCLVVFFASLGPSINRHTALFLRTMIFAGFCIVVWGLAEILLASAGNLQFRHEPRAVFSGSATLAIYLLVVIPVAVVSRGRGGGRGFWLMAITVACAGFILLLATRSRIGLLALVVSGGVYLLLVLLQRQMNGGKLLGAVVTLTLAVIAALAMVVYKTVYTTGIEPQNIPALFQEWPQLGEVLLRSRLTAWGQGIELMLQSPIVGNGAIDNVYNVFLQLGGSFGIPAVLAFVLLVFYCLKPTPCGDTVYAPGQTYAFGMLWSALALLLVSLAESTLGNQLAYLVWTVLLLTGFRHRLVNSSGPRDDGQQRKAAATRADIPVGNIVPDWNQ